MDASRLLAASWPLALVAGTFLLEWRYPAIGRLAVTLATGVLLCTAIVYLRRARRHLRDAIALRAEAIRLVALAEQIGALAPRAPRH